MGSYISQDPIGLAGGNATLYGYVGDPNSWIDPLGLICTLRTSELRPTHGVTKSKKQMQRLLDDIRQNGINEPIRVVKHNGQSFIVDGHHRYFAAIKLGISEVPVM